MIELISYHTKSKRSTPKLSVHHKIIRSNRYRNVNDGISMNTFILFYLNKRIKINEKSMGISKCQSISDEFRKEVAVVAIQVYWKLLKCWRRQWRWWWRWKVKCFVAPLHLSISLFFISKPNLSHAYPYCLCICVCRVC